MQVGINIHSKEFMFCCFIMHITWYFVVSVFCIQSAPPTMIIAALTESSGSFGLVKVARLYQVFKILPICAILIIFNVVYIIFSKNKMFGTISSLFCVS